MLFAATLPCWLVVANLYGLYSRDAQRADHSTADDAPAVLNMTTLGAWLLYVLARITGAADLDVPKLIAFWAAAIVAILVSRALARLITRRSIAFVQNSIIVGAGSSRPARRPEAAPAPRVRDQPGRLRRRPPEGARADLERLSVLGDTAELPELVRQFDVERVIVAFYRRPDDSTLERGSRPRRPGRAGRHRPAALRGGRRRDDRPLGRRDCRCSSVPPPGLSWSSAVLKRALDLVVASAALLVLAPLFALVALADQARLAAARCSSVSRGWARTAAASGSGSSGR